MSSAETSLQERFCTASDFVQLCGHQDASFSVNVHLSWLQLVTLAIRLLKILLPSFSSVLFEEQMMTHL